MNQHFQLPTEFEDPAREPIVEWLKAEGIEPHIVPMGARLAYNEKRATIAFFGVVRNADGRPIVQRNGRGFIRRRMTFPILNTPPAELQRVAA